MRNQLKTVMAWNQIRLGQEWTESEHDNPSLLDKQVDSFLNGTIILLPE